MLRPALLLLALCLALSPLPAAAAAFAASAPDGVPVAPDDPGAAGVKAVGGGKLSTDLARLVDPSARLTGQSRADVVRELRGRHAYRGASATENADAAGEVYVYVALAGPGAASRVETFGNVVARDAGHGVVSAWVPAGRLVALASQPFVRTVRSVLPPVLETGSVTSEGDALLGANTFRSMTGSAGGGVAVGVVSDGVASWTQARDSGDLPADLHVLSNTYGGDEGTAMCEIVHDLAPNASIHFHDLGNGEDSLLFADALRELADAGCRVIVDDVAWLDEPYFEDGAVARTVDELVATRGVVYANSAGNYAARHYQGAFVDDGAGFHDFSGNASTEYRQLYVNVPPGSGVSVVLQWDDPFGASGNDYDLALARVNGSLLASSANAQAGSGDPIEVAEWSNAGTAGETVVVWARKTSGAARELEIYLIPQGGAGLYSDNLVAADSIVGNHAAASAITVGAARVSTPNALESFSSRGPATIRWPAPESRQKPELAGPDGGLISGAGGWGYPDGAHYRFYGTSASAPHVAGLVALVWSARPAATNGEVRAALLGSAQDRGPAGFDSGWGHGWPDAGAFGERLGVAVVRAVPGGAGLPTDPGADGRFEDVNGNGDADFADVVLFFNSMDWIAANEPLSAFDYNANGRIDYADVVWLFNRL